MPESVRIDTTDSQFPFMPPITELSGWLSGPKGLHTYLHWMQQDQGLSKPDLHTLRKACQKGVTPRIARMIEETIYTAVDKHDIANLLDEIDYSQPVVSGTNGTKWLATSHGYLHGINRHQSETLKLPNTFNFLESRTAAESQMILAFHQAKTMEASPEKPSEHIRITMIETYRRHTLLSSEEIRTYCTAMTEANRHESRRTLVMVSEILKCIFSLRVDFYHQLLASFMTDMLPLRQSLKLPTSLESALVNHGAMGQLTPLLENGKLITPTYQLYEYWRDAFLQPNVKPMSYRAMATHIPRPLDVKTRVSELAVMEDIRNPANDTRHSRLKEWRSGTVPKTDQLTEFIESLSGEAYGAFLPFIMTRVATIWTNWIEHEREQLEELVEETPALANHLNFEWFVEKFSQYPKYWEHMAQVTTDQSGP